jgi:methylase of polypeptide subunit release factors
MKIQEYKLNNKIICFTDELDGGGVLIAEDICDAVGLVLGGTPATNCLEWCSGAGVIGFSVLSAELCTNLTLLDRHAPCKDLIDLTIKKNNCEDTVKFILSDNFKSVDKNLKFDLIVANPPHFNVDPYHDAYTDPRRYKDTDWKIHEDFFNNVGDFLTDNGRILLIENSWGSGLSTFDDMITKNNLKVNRHFHSTRFPVDLYYLEITRKNYWRQGHFRPAVDGGWVWMTPK